MNPEQFLLAQLDHGQICPGSPGQVHAGIPVLCVGLSGCLWKLLCDEGTVLGSRRVVKPQGCLKGDEFAWGVFQGMFRARLIELYGREEL